MNGRHGGCWSPHPTHLHHEIPRYDKERRVQLLIDEDVLGGEYIGCHPCINTSSIRLKTKDLVEKVIPAMNHPFMKVKL